MPVADLAQELHRRGQRATPQRLAVFAALRDLGRHATAEEVLDAVRGRVPGVSLPTVYAALRVLADLGLVRPVHAGGALLYDPRAEAHHHVVCTACGRVEDVDAEVELGPALRAAQRAGYADAAGELVLRGRCAACHAG